MKSGAKNLLVATVLLGLLGAIAAPKVLPLLRAKKGNDPATAAAPRDNGSGALRVSTVTIKSVPFAESITSTGTLRAEEAVDLQAEVSGKVTAINFREGSRVKKGDLLVKINDADLQATLQRDIFKMQLAELTEERLGSLLKIGGAKQADYDAASNELSVQKAEIALTNAQIAKTEIRAPFDGTIGLRFVSEGSFMMATSTNPIRIATVQAIDNLKIDFSLPEKYAGRVRAGMPITFMPVGSQGRIAGEISAIEPRIDVATRTILIRALCPNPDNRLLPGAYASVELALSQVENAILVPSVAVIPGVSEKNVFVLENGKAQRRAVQTGTRTESAVHILSGIKEGDVVITSGIQQLRSGMPVSVNESPAPTKTDNKSAAMSASPVKAPQS